MYVWELVACRLRGEGWDVWHSTSPGAGAGANEATHRVHLGKGGFSTVVAAPTLTEAYAEAARRARDLAPTPAGPPHFRLTRAPIVND